MELFNYLNDDEVIPPSNTDEVATTTPSNNDFGSNDSEDDKVLETPLKINEKDIESLSQSGRVPEELFIANTNQGYLDLLNERPSRFYLFNRAFMFLSGCKTEKADAFCKVSCELVFPYSMKIYNIFYLSISYNYEREEITVFLNDLLSPLDDKLTYCGVLYGYKPEDFSNKKWVHSFVSFIEAGGVHSSRKKVINEKDI